MASLTAFKVLCETCNDLWRCYEDGLFKYFDNKVNHSEAARQCEIYNSTLLRWNPDANLTAFLNRNYSFWINKTEMEPTTEIPPPTILADHKLDFSDVNKSRRRRSALVSGSSNRNNEKCWYIHGMNSAKGKCDEQRGYVCEMNTTSSLRTCSQYNRTVLDWESAKNACKSDGMTLFSYRNKTPQQIEAENENGYYKDIWIDLRFEHDSKDYRWSDGSILDYGNWTHGQPKDDNNTKLCVALSGPNLQWEVHDCNCSRPYICEDRNATQVTAETTYAFSATNMPSTVTENDATSTENVTPKSSPQVTEENTDAILTTNMRVLCGEPDCEHPNISSGDKLAIPITETVAESTGKGENDNSAVYWIVGCLTAVFFVAVFVYVVYRIRNVGKYGMDASVGPEHRFRNLIELDENPV